MKKQEDSFVDKYTNIQIYRDIEYYQETCV
jgi:hypothetical protein